MAAAPKSTTKRDRFGYASKPHGDGGFGRVMKGRDNERQRDAAVKVLKRRLPTKKPAGGITCETVESVAELVAAIRRDTVDWSTRGNIRPWFRGQSDAGLPPQPSVLRGRYDEFWMTTTYRLKALAFGASIPTDRLDQWLFLMQHYGLPTRLLDWTESPVLACFFAVSRWLESDQPETNYRSPNMGVWMIHPVRLNRLTYRSVRFPNTWASGARDNFRLAFHGPKERQKLRRLPPGDPNRLAPSDFPLAVQASAVDRRVVVQRSCFTIHGWNESDIESMLTSTPFARRYLKKYQIPRTLAPGIWKELETLGTSFSTAFPDLAGLAQELKWQFARRQPDHKLCRVCASRPETSTRRKRDLTTSADVHNSAS